MLIAVAYLTLFERKILGYSQLRKGPNVVGFWGILQPLADGVKLFSKETIIPSHATVGLYLGAPIIALTLGLFPWFLVMSNLTRENNYGITIINHPYSLFILLSVLGMTIFTIALSGWGSNSKYAFLGSIRAVAQMISYEVSMYLLLMSVIMISQSLNLYQIFIFQNVVGYLFPALWPVALMFFVTLLAETNRAPFDLAEGESELVSGYNVEYSSMPFALFFLGEYAAMILMSGMTVILFLGGWLPPIDLAPLHYIPGVVWFLGKIIAVLFCFLWVRATLPRYRYDQLMRLGWKVFLPVSLFWLVATSAVVITMDVYPGTLLGWVGG